MRKDKTAKKEFSKKIGKNIRFYRNERGYTLRELARKIDYSAGYIGIIEQGKATPNSYILYQLASVLAVPVSNFYNENNKEKKLVNNKIPESILAQNEYLQLLKDFALSNIPIKHIKNTVNALNSAYKNKL